MKWYDKVKSICSRFSENHSIDVDNYHTLARSYITMNQTQRVRALRLFIRIAIYILLFFALFNLLSDHYILGALELLYAIITMLLFALIKRKICLTGVSYVFVFLTGTLILFITVAYNARPNTVFWAATFPVIAYYLLGLKRGTIVYALFSVMLVLLVVFLYPTVENALRGGILNIVGGLMFLGLSLFLYEYSRSEALGFAVSRSMFDDLTGAGTRKLFHLIFRQTLTRIKRNNTPAALILIDIDHFKDVNDTYGHLKGDAILKAFTRIVQEQIRKSDTLTRWGGEEFMIIAPDTDITHARKLAEKLRRTLQVHTFETVGEITASFGITQVDPEDTEESAVRRADEALYRAKENGRNRIESA
jgi:diguanylate cyclase (GGDEF)-like protein